MLGIPTLRRIKASVKTMPTSCWLSRAHGEYLLVTSPDICTSPASPTKDTSASLSPEDYLDVSPTKGVLIDGEPSNLEATVKMQIVPSSVV